MDKKVLLVIDMQNDFVSGALPAERAKDIVLPVIQKIEECIKNGYTIVYTMDTHDNSYFNTEEGKNLPVEHCQKGSYGWQIVEGVYKQGCKIIQKNAFTSKELVQFIQAANFTNIELVGLCTDICILKNALLLHANVKNATIAVHKHLTAGTTQQKHIATLKILETKKIKIL